MRIDHVAYALKLKYGVFCPILSRPGIDYRNLLQDSTGDLAKYLGIKIHLCLASLLAKQVLLHEEFEHAGAVILEHAKGYISAL